MAISYELAPNPKWYIADLVGRPLGGGSMYTYRSLDKTDLKFIYQDSAGNFPWTDPVLFDENGAQGPFYWEVDSLNPDELYYIEVYDADGVLQWTVDHFIPPQGGGGSIITTALDLENLIVNNVLWRNVGSISSPLPVLATLAPGAHAGFCENAESDIIFKKTNTSAVDLITFVPFTLGTTPLNGDVTPVDYLHYECNNTPSGETSKVVQFPITTQVQNLSNQDIICTIWAKSSSSSPIQLYVRQFFGDGVGASAEVITPIGSALTLTPTWEKYPVTGTIPSVSGKTPGGCGNSALFLQVSYPVDTSCNIDFTKPSMYLGGINPEEDYHTYDMIDSVINAPRTGDLRIGLNSFYPFGWVIMNDGTIGNSSSNSTTRANTDTFPLFSLLWRAFQGNQSLAPMFTSAGVPVAYGASPADDFDASRQMALTKSSGRLLANFGTPSSGNNTGNSWSAGQTTGNELVTIIANNLPAHTHSAPGGQNFVITSPGGALTVGAGAGVTVSANTDVNTTGNAAINVQNPVAYFNVFMKL